MGNGTLGTTLIFLLFLSSAFQRCLVFQRRVVIKWERKNVISSSEPVFALIRVPFSRRSKYPMGWLATPEGAAWRGDRTAMLAATRLDPALVTPALWDDEVLDLVAQRRGPGPGRPGTAGRTCLHARRAPGQRPSARVDPGAAGRPRGRACGGDPAWPGAALGQPRAHGGLCGRARRGDPERFCVEACRRAPGRSGGRARRGGPGRHGPAVRQRRAPGRSGGRAHRGDPARLGAAVRPR